MSNTNSRHKEMNQRFYNRNIPSETFQPYLDVRPVMTKYSILPIVDPRKELTTKMIQKPTYDINHMFHPGNTKSPFSGFASNITVENELRNQIFALQKCSQSTYVPQSNSDLYNYSFSLPTTSQQPHSLLFHEEKFDNFNPNLENVGFIPFYNSTRVQVKDIYTDKP